MTDRIAILGAGLCGNLLAIMLARHGFEVTVFERDASPDQSQTARRSINLALAARGIRALEHAGSFDNLTSLLLPMSGRIVHGHDGSQRLLPYGQHENEQIWSVSREALNSELIGIARDELGVDYRFGHRCSDFDAETMTATLQSDDGIQTIAPDLLLAADGAGSVVRRQLASAGRLTASEVLLDHGYKELTIPQSDEGGFSLDAGGLHIWPRGGFMLIALPNLDRTFTATLFLPHQGNPGFDSLNEDNVVALFAEQFPDALERMPNLSLEFSERPVGNLGTVYCQPWSLTKTNGRDRCVLLIGDAAHAIVPFHGQGMNAAFEDCSELVGLIEKLGPDWPGVTSAFESARRDNARAIAEMALENYDEMRDTVRDESFSRRSVLAFRLEQRFPGRFIPRYSMVMFHPEIGYAEAQRRGRIQREILDAGIAAGDPDSGFAIASDLVERRL